MKEYLYNLILVFTTYAQKAANKHVLTNFSVNFPRDAVDSLLTFIFVETCMNVLHRRVKTLVHWSLHVA